MLHSWDDGGKTTESVRMTVDIFCRLFSMQFRCHETAS